jgi:hypothetical protein
MSLGLLVLFVANLFFFSFGFLEDFLFFGGEQIAVTSTGGVCTLGLARSR